MSGNVVAKGISVPRVIGTHHADAPLLSSPLIEFEEDAEFGEVVVFGLAGPHAITDMGR